MADTLYTPEKALELLRHRLLDLTNKNLFINFKNPFEHKSALGLVNVDQDLLFSKLKDSSAVYELLSVEDPKLAEDGSDEWTKEEWITSTYGFCYKASQPDLDPNYLQTFEFNSSYSKKIDKHLKDAKLSLEETGVNTSYILFGFLEYAIPGEDDTQFAPLLCLPVYIQKKENTLSTYQIGYTGAPVLENFALKEKLKQMHGFTVPEFEEDYSPDSVVSNYLEKLRNVVEETNWIVHPWSVVASVSPMNMILFNDVREESWNKEGFSLISSPLLSKILDTSVYEKEYEDPIELDSLSTLLPSYPDLIQPADGSQLLALVKTLGDKSGGVIVGPPGSGKSQTITNLIANYLSAGKKVLFVSEKLAALDVVKSKLSKSGLDSLVLALHSNKVNKKDIVMDLVETVNTTCVVPEDTDKARSSLEEIRQYLAHYCHEVNYKNFNKAELSFYEIVWKLAELRETLSNKPLLEVDSSWVESLSSLDSILFECRKYLEAESVVGRYGKEHPLYSFSMEGLTGDSAKKLKSVLEERMKHLSKLNAIGARFKEHGYESLDELGVLESSLREILPLVPKKFNNELITRLKTSGIHVLKAINYIDEYLVNKERYQSLMSEVSSVFKDLDTLTKEPELAKLDSLDSVAQYLMKGEDISGLEDALYGLKSVLFHLKNNPLNVRLPELLGKKDLTVSDVASIESVSELFMEDLPDVEYYREELVLPKSVKLLSELSELASEIERSFLTVSLTLDDTLVPKGQLYEAALFFKMNSGPTKYLNPKWYTYVGFYKKLATAQTDLNVPLSVKIAEISMLASIRSKLDVFESKLKSSSLSDFYEGLATPLAELQGWADWLLLKTKTERKLGIDFFWEKGFSEGLSFWQKNSANLSELVDFYQRIKILCTKVGLDPDQLPASKLMEVDVGLNDLVSLVKSLKPYVYTSASIYEVVSASKKLAELKELGKLLNNETIRKLWGKNQDLTILRAHYEFMAALKKHSLPTSLVTVICAQEPSELISALIKFAKGLRMGPSIVDALLREVSALDIGFMPSRLLGASSVDMADWRSLEVKCQNILNSAAVWEAWSEYLELRNNLIGSGFRSFIQGLEDGVISAENWVDWVHASLLDGLAKNCMNKAFTLKTFQKESHLAKIEEYAKLDSYLIEAAPGKLLAKRLEERVLPRGESGAKVKDYTENVLLSHLSKTPNARISLRDIFSRAKTSIQELKPCFMMGPQAVAQYLKPHDFKFDVVIIDEASQMKLEHALGAIIRADKLVVVGDPNQLGPSTSFTAIAENNTEWEILNTESILSWAMAKYPSTQLNWHYRSRHQSLIDFSNKNFYQNSLVVLPSAYPRSEVLGLNYYYEDNTSYNDSVNSVEAERIVAHVVRHMKTRLNESLGVVCLNMPQTLLVESLVEAELSKDPSLRDYVEKWNALNESFFIKNLENVQGDERDVVLISLTYGKTSTSAGTVLQNFGLFSRADGWRRLNVLLTRAKVAMHVYSSLKSTDIKEHIKMPKGTEAFASFLKYAETLDIQEDMVAKGTVQKGSSAYYSSILSRMLGEVLSRNGYSHTQFGTQEASPYSIDLAVKATMGDALYVGAIEGDGPAYAKCSSVKDRDRLRKHLLEQLGWKDMFYRVWSVGWYLDAEEEKRDIIKYLEAHEHLWVP